MHFYMRTDYLGLCYSWAEQMQMNGENCTKLCLSPILFLYNIYGGISKLILNRYLPFYKHV